jgi:hypothetical protein
MASSEASSPVDDDFAANRQPDTDDDVDPANGQLEDEDDALDDDLFGDGAEGDDDIASP